MFTKTNWVSSLSALVVFASILWSSCTSSQSRTQQTEAPKQSWGVQLYTLRSLIGTPELYEANHTRVLDSLKAIGFDEVELYGYSEDGTIFGVPAQQFMADLKAAGLHAISSHVQNALTPEEVESGDFSKKTCWWQKCLKDHQALGVDTLVYVWYEMPKTEAQLKRMAEYMTYIGAMCHDKGIAFGYHNHDHELGKVDNTVVLDYLIEHTAAELLFIELDVYWTVVGKANPLDYFNRYPGRFKLLHIKDQYEIGQSGMVAFDSIFKALDKSGAQHLIVEQETTLKSSMLESLTESMEFLKTEL